MMNNISPKTATTNQEWVTRRQAVIARGMGMAAPVFIDRAENAEMWDVEGRRYLDFAGGIAVLNTGHRHPKVLARVREQLEHVTHTCAMITPYPPFVELADALIARTPISGPKKAIFVTTGAEAVENAVKIARAHTKRSDIVVFTGGFHGRTLLTMGITGKVLPYKKDFGPFPGGIWRLPFPIPQIGLSSKHTFEVFKWLLKTDVEVTDIAAIVIEPVQGEGGFYVAPPEFLAQLREFCDQHGIVLIADEIQSGFGRTGTWFAMEHSGVEPDIITSAKSLAGGFPIAAVVGKAAIMDAPDPGGLGGTYAGNAVACAAALGVIEAIEEEKLLERATRHGQIIRDRLTGYRDGKKGIAIGDVRGLGAMIAFDVVKGWDNPEPDADATKALTQRCLALGLLIITCGLWGNTVRLLQPLTIPDAQLVEGLDLLEQALLG